MFEYHLKLTTACGLLVATSLSFFAGCVRNSADALATAAPAAPTKVSR
jgi:hypothetical protein